MLRTLTPDEIRLISNVFVQISIASWFEQRDADSIKRYLLHRYVPGQDEGSLRTVSEPFAREWFQAGRRRFDVLDHSRAQVLSPISVNQDPSICRRPDW